MEKENGNPGRRQTFLALRRIQTPRMDCHIRLYLLVADTAALTKARGGARHRSSYLDWQIESSRVAGMASVDFYKCWHSAGYAAGKS